MEIVINTISITLIFRMMIDTIVSAIIKTMVAMIVVFILEKTYSLQLDDLRQLPE